jgi:Xaa-Pro aminopeptidase
MSADEQRLDGAVVDRLESYADKRDLAAVWVARSNSFAWLTGGNNAVDRGTEPGVAAAGYDGDGLRVVTDSVEADRLADEQLPEDVAVALFPWHETTLAEYLAAESPRPAAADIPVEGFERVDTAALRQPLTDADVDRYRTLGETAARAVEGVCRDCSPDDTERAVAADLRGRLAAAGVDAPVALVGGQRRTQQYRHYTPTDERLGGYALVSVTATRAGLYASCTRTVAFDPPEWLSDRHRAAARVEVSALAATRAVGRAGGSAGDVFDSVRSAYAGVGQAGEWRQHHQGGAAGYAGREWIARPDGEATVRLPMAYAWNPTVRGAKSEGTVLVTGDRVEPLTATGEWPTVEVSAVDAGLTVDRPAVLTR